MRGAKGPGQAARGPGSPPRSGRDDAGGASFGVAPAPEPGPCAARAQPAHWGPGSVLRSVRDDEWGSCRSSVLLVRSVLPAAGLPAGRDPVSRVLRARPFARRRALAPARFARLIARARRRAHFSRAFLQVFSRRREQEGEAAPRMPLPSSWSIVALFFW